MKKAIAMQWAAALESGDYKQSSAAALRTASNKFDALGVLCNLHAMAHPDIAAAQTHVEIYMDEDGELPHAVRDWAGLADSCGGVRSSNKKLGCTPKDKTGYSSIAGCHDGGLTFERIAQIIRNQYTRI